MLSVILSTILVFNEVMTSNVGATMSPAINFDSWVELYNPGDQDVNLAGMYLSDDTGNLKLWQMPTDMGKVPAKGFKVVWLGSNDIKSNQAPFKLDCDGGIICLSDKNGQLIVSQEYPEGMSRTSWARKTDGGDEWGWTADVTPGASNATATFATQRLAAPVPSASSQLFKNSVTVKVDIPEGATLMYTTDGSLPSAPQQDTGIAVPEWIDYVENGDCEGTEGVSLSARNFGESEDVYTITEGAGVDGSRGIKVHAGKNAQNDHDAQLFIYTPGHIWRSGEKYRFHMMVRADKAGKISAQSHEKPHGYIDWQMFDGKFDSERYKVSTEWQEFTFEGTISDAQAGVSYDWWTGKSTSKDMQTIAINLNIDRQDNNFYFDNISWELFVGEEQTDKDTSKKSETGEFTFSQTTNLTLRLFQNGYLPSVPVTRSYIKTSDNYTLPVISIVGDKKYFTDPKIGFDCDGDGTNGKTGNGQDWPRNYNMNWDRPVNFSYLSPEGEMLFNQDVNIKASGGWTRSQRFRSFKLKSSKLFDGQNRYDYPFFPQKPYIRSKTLLVRNGGNDVWTHNARFLDAALETVIQRSGIDLDVQSCVPVIEYVNGELRGVFNMREPNNDDFAYANWGYDDEEIDAFENAEIKNGDDVALKRIFELGYQCTDDAAYDELKTLLDIDEFTNYMAVTMFIDNDDWPNNNMKAYRNRDGGRYRFISFDLDYAFALRNFNKDNDNPFTYFLRFKDADEVYGESNQNHEIVRLFLNLMGRDEFRRQFIDTFCLVAGSVFEPNRANAVVDELLKKVQPMCQLMKQRGINDGHDPQRAAQTIKDKLKDRSKKMTGHLKSFSYAKLSNSAQAVTLKTNVVGARLFVNDLAIPAGHASMSNGLCTLFSGHLFAPVTLRAEAPAGYRFSGWKKAGTVVSTDPEMSLPTGTVDLTATFTQLSDSELANTGITPVRINEVSAANGIYVNEYFKRNDWVELYNTTDHDIDIQGMYLSDNPEKPKKYQFTSSSTSYPSTVIPAHGYLIVWCDKLEPQSALHTSFKLDAEGGSVLITAEDESWSDRLTYTQMNSDQTVGRYPDGSGNIYVMNLPTIAQTNLLSSYALNIERPDPTGISSLTSHPVDVNVYNLKGQAVRGTLAPGIYISNGKKIVIK